MNNVYVLLAEMRTSIISMDLSYSRTTKLLNQILEIEKAADSIELSEERPQGEWIIDGHHIRCNRCNEYICNTDREGNKIPDNYCPNCGADMRKDGTE